MQEEETVDYRWLSYDEFWVLIKTDEFVDKISDCIVRHIDEIRKIVQM